MPPAPSVEKPPADQGEREKWEAQMSKVNAPDPGPSCSACNSMEHTSTFHFPVPPAGEGEARLREKTQEPRSFRLAEEVLVAWRESGEGHYGLECRIAAQLREAEQRGAEAAAKIAESGRFLHDDSPEARFGRSVAAAIRRALVPEEPGEPRG